ncbi:MAG: AAA family ATPase [Alphaproteobacteria bacterium]|nr:AAA family ATPase [Alphaproteobacteria bacterium]
MKTVAFFNNKGGVGKTSLVYHVAWMFAELRLRVITADLDPQANLSSMFLPPETLEGIWNDDGHNTIHSAMAPLIRGTGDIREPVIMRVDDRIGLLIGDLALSRYEDELSAQWPKCLAREERAFRVTTAFDRLIDAACREFGADVALVDVGPNLGAINRAALIACDYVVIPLGPDMFSLQGLRNKGPALRDWRRDWEDRRSRSPTLDFRLPLGRMDALGYVIMRHSVRLDRPVKAYAQWIERMPKEFRSSVLNEQNMRVPRIEDDPHCLAQFKDYRSLMPMAQESNKPMFLLKPGDGAIGGHQTAVQSCYTDFKQLALEIAKRCGIGIPA